MSSFALLLERATKPVSKDEYDKSAKIYTSYSKSDLQKARKRVADEASAWRSGALRSRKQAELKAIDDLLKESDETETDPWTTLFERRALPSSSDLGKDIHTSRHSFKDATPAQRKALKTPGVATSRASTFRAPDMDAPKGKLDKVHPSKLRLGDVISYHGKPHEVAGVKGQTVTLRSYSTSSPKTFKANLAMDPGYKGRIGMGRYYKEGEEPLVGWERVYEYLSLQQAYEDQEAGESDEV